MTLVIANGSFILFATVGGILAMSYETVQTRYSIKEILPRLVVAFLCANASFLLTGKATASRLPATLFWIKTSLTDSA
ncbi:hypothetical protein [Microbispora sp. H10670]|uniref:hypothetical protein n=1 Tax=Microbispora sp. H10670 TaxID=2729108 RepID=UPI001601437F|nr:hypothetical protein [Microbispora sp. H10670]